MTQRGLPRQLLAIAALATLMTVAGTARAVAFEVADTSWEGCSELYALARTELGPDRVVLTATLDWEQLRASDGVLVLHPMHPLDAEEAAAYMKAGGRMAVLDDYGKGDRLLAHFKIHRRNLPMFPAQYLRGKPELAVATPALDSQNGEVLGLHPTVADVRTVVLNHGTGLEHPDLTPVLEVRGSHDGSGNVDESVAVAVAGQVEKGRLFAMGDPSAFINMMLRYPGNRTFAKGVLHYLADGDATQPRHGKLYLVVNEFDEKNSFGGVTPARKALDRKLQALAEALDDVRQRGFPWWLHTMVAAFCGLGVLWWAARSLLRVYAARLPRFARETPLAAQGGAAGRVAVLASPASPPALALLELRAALCESLAATLGKSEHAPPGELLADLQARGVVDEGLMARAVRVLGLMRAAEGAVMGSSAPRVSKSQVLRAAEVVEELLARAKRS
jgi:hypothetical protein